VAEGVFTPQYMRQNPVVMGPATLGPNRNEGAEYVTDDDKIKEQLKMLGYL
jgi:hypothetical protein